MVREVESVRNSFFESVAKRVKKDLLKEDKEAELDKVAEKVNTEMKDFRATYKAVTADISYHGRKIYDVDEDGKIKKVKEWSGTRFRVTTKDGHEIWYTISDTDIRDEAELNKLIVTVRKYASELTLEQARKRITGKTFSTTGTLGNASNFVCLLRLDGPRGLRPLVTRNKYTKDEALGLGSATKDYKQGFYGADLGRLMPGRNGGLKTFVYSLVNGYMRGGAGQMINMINPKLPKKWQLHTVSLEIDQMNEVAKEIVKYGKSEQLWESTEQTHRQTAKWEAQSLPPLEIGEDVAEELELRTSVLAAKEASLGRRRMWGLSVDENLKKEIVQLKEEVSVLQQISLYSEGEDELQQDAVRVLANLWQMRKEVRDQMAEERLRPLDEQDTGEMERREKRLQRALDQIQEIIRLRTLIDRQPELDVGERVEKLNQAQAAFFELNLDDNPSGLNAAMDQIDKLIDSPKAILFDLIDYLSDAIEEGTLFINN